MAASGKIADEGNDLALSLLLDIGTPTAPTAVYLALTTVIPTETTTLATMTEVSDTGYSRQAVTFSTPANDGGKRATHNTAELTFGDFAVGGIEIVGAVLTDAASGTSGTAIAIFDLGTTIYTNAGQSVTVPITTGLVIKND